MFQAWGQFADLIFKFTLFFKYIPLIYSAQGMSDHFRFPYGPSSSVATIGNDSQVEDRIGEKERGIKGRGNDLVFGKKKNRSF